MPKNIKLAEQDFFNWLPTIMSCSAIDKVRKSYKIINAMLVQKKMLNQALVVTTQIIQVEKAIKRLNSAFGNKKIRNNALKLLMTYASYLKENNNSKFPKNRLINTKTKKNWIYFNFTNSKQFENTIPVFCSINGQEYEEKNWVRILVSIVEHELTLNKIVLKKLYKTSLVGSRKRRPFFLKNKIEGLHCSKLSNGYWINVNYNIPNLMMQIEKFCIFCGYNKKQLKIYGILKNKKIKSKRNNKTVTSKIVSNEINVEAVEEYLTSLGLNGATVQDIIGNVKPSASTYSMQNILNEDMNVIFMPDDRYVHISAFVDMNDAEKGMYKILQTHFAQFGGYSNNKLLFGAASHDLSMFLNDNNCEDVNSTYALAQYFFSKKQKNEKLYFSFPHIFQSEPDYPPNLKGLMIKLARVNDGVLCVDEAKSYLQKTKISFGNMNQLLQLSSSNTFVLYDSNRYLLTEKIGINKEWILELHNRLDDLFRQADVAYVIPRDIKTTWLKTLPLLPNGINWTILFLQEILRICTDVGFRYITTGLHQSRDTIASAIVPVNSLLQSFPDIVTLFMQEHYALPKRMSSEELRHELCEVGMLNGYELIRTLHKALNDYRFSWTDGNKNVYVRGN